MAEKKLLLGDEAIALGAIHAGISGVYAYPGTPSTEITEFIQNNPLAKERKLHSTWCTNEKTAMEMRRQSPKQTPRSRAVRTIWQSGSTSLRVFTASSMGTATIWVPLRATM